MERIRLTYGFDAYCGWCYGYGPALRQFVAENAHRIELRVISGGLFTGTRAQPIAHYPHIPDANTRIAKLTGVSFGQPYLNLLADGHFILDSTGPAVGLVALRRQAPHRALEFAAALQRAFYQQGCDLSAADTYRILAAELDVVDVAAVLAALVDPAVRAEADEDFRETRRLGIESYPTLLLHTDNGVRRLGGAGSTAKALGRALDEALEDQAARVALRI